MVASRSDAAYAASVARIRAQVNAFAAARFAVGDHRDADLERFLAQVVPVALAGRRQTSALTDAHLSRVMSAKLGRSIRPAGPIDTALLRGVAAAEVYARPFKTVWWKLSAGLPIEAAVSAGAARLVDIVAADMQLAKTTTAKHTMAAAGFTRYGRVLSGNSCDLCIEAASSTYATEDLMPCHPGCNCDVEPIEGDAEVDTHMNGVVIREHGELGAVLAVKGQHFDGPSVAN